MGRVRGRIRVVPHDLGVLINPHQNNLLKGHGSLEAVGQGDEEEQGQDAVYNHEHPVVGACFLHVVNEYGQGQDGSEENDDNEENFITPRALSHACPVGFVDIQEFELLAAASALDLGEIYFIAHGFEPFLDVAEKAALVVDVCALAGVNESGRVLEADRAFVSNLLLDVV